MVKLRMDRRLADSLDASDVLGEAYLDLAARLAEYATEPTIPFFLWLRLVTGHRLTQVHHRHLKAGPDTDLKVSLRHGPLPEASTVYLASHLLGQHTSATSHQRVRAEIQLKLQETLNEMAEADREILALRHFEELTNEETAQVLNISLAAASGRYVRALSRLKEALSRIPGMFDQ
jgi:RNA polymerase sigma-70 factor (ECF subfamily)